MREKIETRLEKARASSREANFKAYHQKKQEALNKAKQEKAMKLLNETKARASAFDAEHAKKKEQADKAWKDILKRSRAVSYGYADWKRSCF